LQLNKKPSLGIIKILPERGLAYNMRKFHDRYLNSNKIIHIEIYQKHCTMLQVSGRKNLL
jgi:hypothetical protein